MINQYAYIQIESKILPLGGHDFSYSLVTYDESGHLVDVSRTWRGPIRISGGETWSMAQIGAITEIGPFRLRTIDYDQFSMDVILVIDGFNAYRLFLTRRLGKYVRWIYLRLIITAHVWGLADYRPEVVPTWRNVKILSRLSRLMGGGDA